MNYKIQTHIVMLASFMLCNTSSMVLAAVTSIAAEGDMNMPGENVLSTALRVEGDVVEMLPPGVAMRENTTLRCKRFEWLGKAEKDTTVEERLKRIENFNTSDQMKSTHQLVENFNTMGRINLTHRLRS